MRGYQALKLALVFGLIVLGTTTDSRGQADETLLIGRARVEITPQFPTILAGYGGRVGEHTAVDQRLFARALAIGGEDVVVTVSVDSCGVPGAVVEEVSERVSRRWGVPAERLVIASTHTHNAPSLTGYAPVLWAERATPDELARAERYTRELVDALCDVVGQAMEDRRSARLFWGQGRVDFGGNRRVLADGRWAGFGLQADGPVDHTLPLLVARDEAGEPLAFWLSYACHCTTLGSGNTIAGDWAGYAAEFLERSYAGTVAVVTIGCGADVGPQPSGSDEFARQHGQSIHDEVQRLLAGELQELSAADARPRVETRHVELPFAEVPGREHWEREASREGFEGVHARRMLARWDQQGELPRFLPYTITTWSFGERFHVVFLPGEVSVDYAVRLKRELDWTRLWIQAWSDDVPCYIPSRRLLEEGGYETDFSMIYYDHPNRFAPELEERIIDAVKEALGESAQRHEGTPEFTADRYVISPEVLRRRWRDLLQSLERESLRAMVDRILVTEQVVLEGAVRVLSESPAEDSWYDYTGGMRRRPYVRQSELGRELAWESAEVPERRSGSVWFTGGLGYLSQPATEGFELEIEGVAQRLRFDVVNGPASWESSTGNVKLEFLPLWRSSEDAAGLFRLSWTEGELSGAGPMQIRVRSRGADSLRWFAVDVIPETRDWKGVREVAEEVLGTR